MAHPDLRTDGARPLHDVTAADLMTRDPFTLRPDDTLLHAVKQLTRRGFSGAPVVDEAGLLVGVFSQHDGIKAVLDTLYHDNPPARVAAYMSRELCSVLPETHLVDVAAVFVNRRLRRLPVVDRRGSLLGQVSRHDLLAVALTAFEADPDQEAPSLYLSALDAPPPHAG